MTLQWRSGNDEEDMIRPWEDIPEDGIIWEESYPVIQVRQKPAFEPWWYRAQGDPTVIMLWDTEPSSTFWKKVKVFDEDTGDQL